MVRISVAFLNVLVLILNVLHLVHVTMIVSMAVHVKMEVNFVFRVKKNLHKAPSYRISNELPEERHFTRDNFAERREIISRK